MMLPPLCCFPRNGFALLMASESWLIVIKHLHRHEISKVSWHCTHESALIRIVFMNISAHKLYT